MLSFRACVLMCVLVAAVACGDDTPTAPEQPVQRPTITEPPFQGTVTVNGAASHSFTTGSGQIAVTVTELVPNSAAVIGVSLGTWNALANTCQIVLANDSATQGATVLGTASSPGDFCVRIYDVGRLAAATGYTLTVVHF
jgi:hypothetical protein